MAFLNVSLLLLANFVLLDYLEKLFYERFLEWQANRQIIGNHPEMVGVDPVSYTHLTLPTKA